MHRISGKQHQRRCLGRSRGAGTRSVPAAQLFIVLEHIGVFQSSLMHRRILSGRCDSLVISATYFIIFSQGCQFFNKLSAPQPSHRLTKRREPRSASFSRYRDVRQRFSQARSWLTVRVKKATDRIHLPIAQIWSVYKRAY